MPLCRSFGKFFTEKPSNRVWRRDLANTLSRVGQALSDKPELRVTDQQIAQAQTRLFAFSDSARAAHSSALWIFRGKRDYDF